MNYERIFIWKKWTCLENICMHTGLFFFTQWYSNLYVTIKTHCTLEVIHMHMGAAAKISEPYQN